MTEEQQRMRSAVNAAFTLNLIERQLTTCGPLRAVHEFTAWLRENPTHLYVLFGEVLGDKQ